MQHFNENDGYADSAQMQQIYERMKQIAYRYKATIKQLAYDCLIREGSEAIAVLEREVIIEQLHVEMQLSTKIDCKLESHYYSYFCDQLGDAAFLAIDETEVGIEVIVAYDALYDADIACELHEVVPMIEQQQLSLTQALQWLAYYQSYHCYGIPNEIFAVLQAPKIVEQCLQRIACANRQDVMAVAKQERVVPLQAIYAQLTAAAQSVQTTAYQEFFDFLQRFIWESEDDENYPCLKKCTQQLHDNVVAV